MWIRLALAAFVLVGCGEPKRNGPAPVGGTEPLGHLTAQGGQGEATGLGTSAASSGSSDSSGGSGGTGNTAGMTASDASAGTFGSTLPGTDSLSGDGTGGGGTG